MIQSMAPITIQSVVFAAGSVTITVAQDAAAILAAIAASTSTTGVRMSELDDRISEIQAAEAGQTASLARLITDFESVGTLTAEQTERLAAIKQHLVDNQAQIDAVDPAAPPA